MSRLYERDGFDRALRRFGLTGLGSFVPHPPANALLLRPLARLSPPMAKTIWTLLLAAAYVGSLLILARTLPLDAPRMALIGLLPTASLANALAYGQPYPLFLLLASASLWAATRERWATAGALLAPIVVLKLYALLFLPVFLWQRRWRALAGLAAGAAVLVLLSVAALGTEVHAVYVREILPASLEGRIQDPYSTVWQSGASLSRRLFEREADLNPRPLLDRPSLARGLARALTAGVAALAVAAAAGRTTPSSQWAVLLAGGLAASPLTATYHFVLLVLPAAVFLSRAPGRGAAASMLLLFAFATSSWPHHFHRWAEGAGHLLAQPRYFAVLALLVLMARPWPWRRRGMVAAGLVALVAAWTARPEGPPPRWTRLPADGYLQAEPIACGRGHAWLAVESMSYVVRGSDGARAGVGEPPAVPACVDGQLTTASPPIDTSELRARFGAPARHARPSPDGAWIAAQVWRRGSWDVEAAAIEDGRIVSVASAPSNEVEPSWSMDGREVLFASDRGRGLGSTAIYSVPLGAAQPRAREAGQVGHGVE